MSETEATYCLMDAVNDYAHVWDRLRPEMLMDVDQRLASALEAWSDRPKLPQPTWPEFFGIGRQDRDGV